MLCTAVASRMAPRSPCVPVVPRAGCVRSTSSKETPCSCHRPKARMVAPGRVARSRRVRCRCPSAHHVHGTPLTRRGRRATRSLYVAMGCFWGAERIFWRTRRASTRPRRATWAAGHANPTYEETCTGRTGHTEAGHGGVRPRARSSLETLLAGVLGEPRPDHGQPPGQRRRHPVPHRRSSRPRRAVRRRRGLARAVPGSRSPTPGYGEIATQIAPRPRPATAVLLRRGATTSSTSTRTPTGTATTASARSAIPRTSTVKHPSRVRLPE